MEIALADIKKVVEKRRRIIITTHVHPDGDAIGSSLALYFYLVSLGKDVRLIIDDQLPAYLKFLPGSQSILKYDGTPLEADLVIELDVSDSSRVGNVKCADAKILNIDHHVSNTNYADYWYVKENAAATGEIILEFLRSAEADITPEIATCLFTAIATDCGFFQFANTTAATFQLAAELVSCGASPHAVSEAITIKSLNVVQTLPAVLETLAIDKTASGVTVASLTLQREIMAKLDNDTEDFIKYPRCIAGIDVAVVYKMTEENVVKVSMRSRQIDVSRVALSFGGGGHVRAAGCTINGSIDFARQELMAAIERCADKPEADL